MNFNRREFLKLTSKSALLGGAYLNMPLSLEANTGTNFTDYKALVCVTLHGGNDSMNTFIPSGTDADKGYAKYASIRGELTISNSELDVNTHNAYAHSSGLASDAYLKGFYKHTNVNGLATNALMPEIAKLIDSNKIAIVANMGTLVEPTTRAQYRANSVSLPKSIFSHNSQRRIMESGVADDLKELGWAGRLFDEWESVNSNHLYGMNVSYAGKPYLFNARKTSPLVLSSGAPIGYSTMNSTNDPDRLKLYTDLHSIEYQNPFKRIYNSILGTSFSLVDSLAADWTASHTFTSTNDYGVPLFNIPSISALGIEDVEIKDSFSNQLKAVAKMIKTGKAKGLKRQIFYVKLDGFDTHSGQLSDHPKLLRTLSLGMGDFQAALGEIGMENEVTAFTLSDFGRSTGSNGDGTDHAWGGHHFAIGGAVKGGLYGTLPDLNLGGVDDSGGKGRLIPTTSLDEYLSTLLTWYGVDDAIKEKILPNLKNFNNPNLGFL